MNLTALKTIALFIVLPCAPIALASQSTPTAGSCSSSPFASPEKSRRDTDKPSIQKEISLRHTTSDSILKLCASLGCDKKNIVIKAGKQPNTITILGQKQDVESIKTFIEKHIDIPLVIKGVALHLLPPLKTTLTFQ